MHPSSSSSTTFPAVAQGYGGHSRMNGEGEKALKLGCFYSGMGGVIHASISTPMYDY